jgi:hypothetical protein
MEMERDILYPYGENADISIIHSQNNQGNSWGNFEVGKKSQINFILKANRDIEYDIYLKWKCSCCSEDFCSKDSIINKLKFINNQGKRVDYLKVGPLNNGQSVQIAAEANFIDVVIEDEFMKTSIGVLVFELKEGNLNTKLEEKIISLTPFSAQISHIMTELADNFESCNVFDEFLMDEKNLLGLAILVVASLEDYHIDHLIVDDLSPQLMGALAIVKYLNKDEYSIVNITDVQNNKVEFKSASNIAFFFEAMNDDTDENIEYFQNSKGCEIIKIIFLQKNDKNIESLSEPVEFLFRS